MSTETIHPTKLALFHKNPRQGDLAAIEGSLRANSQYKPIVVNRGTHTGRPLEVIAGNHTLMAIRNLTEKHPDDERWHNVLVHYVDVDDDRAARIVAADNRTAQLGSFDDRLLLELLSDLEDLDGTGYDNDDLAELEDMIADRPDPAREDEGAAIALWGSTVGDPDITPDKGTVWTLGRHTLAVLEVYRDHTDWVPLLTDDHLFYPYPTILAPFLDSLEDRPALFVQPDPYLAGWLITKWNRLRPDQQAVQVS